MADDDGSERDRGEASRESAPLEGLADRVRARRTTEPSPTPETDAADEDPWDLSEFFDEESYDELESDELWETVDDTGELGAGVEAGEGPNEHIVPKRSYCEGCEHFSAPPEVRCEHAGTTIVEFPDIDHVRVRNCPVVAERRALDREGREPMAADSIGE